MLFSVFLFVLLCGSSPAAGEIFTALADMEGLVKTEQELVNHLQSYINEEEARIQRLKMHMNEYKRMYTEASNDVSKFLANPINAYVLVKRLTTDWKQVENEITQNSGQELIKNITDHRGMLRFPTDEDLAGAAVALMRLQDTYKLDTRALAEGILQGKKYSQHLTAGDCFELGRQSYNKGDHYHSAQWMGEALRKSDEETTKTADRQEILDYLSFSYYNLGDVKMALHLTKEMLKIVPYHQRGLSNQKYYTQMLKDSDPNEKETSFSAENIELPKPQAPLPEFETYEMLCRGEKKLDVAVSSKLHCRYDNKGVPFFFLQPIKEEEAYLNPRIVIYHDVISDDEIELVKKMAQPRFKRATVQNQLTGALEPASYRISKSSWLKIWEHPYIARISRRMQLITGLDMETAEDLQVVNYGIGGHYEPHFDFARKEEVNAFKDLNTGNRIATWLYYMSDVEAGGATVFTRLDLALWPQKGSAAFWYNLLPSGEGNYLTRHAACPVLTGSKWVSNRWIHEYQQEFRRPCRLDQYAPN